jgi:hypothetical protein
MFSLSPREARVGREPERGAIQEKLLLFPALSSLLRREEREKAGRPGGYGTQGAHKVRRILSSLHGT